ncbi:MAG: tRNA (N6-threonylcarbamoyladenosine(37)-N6)-methyltransferase TrmO [Clostridiales bacterium]|nr:tRNA (N6-threonylcarbamoyladenosine(37)-N6)-methyltransferase TrmO [Clostridiales bacterium]
MKIIAHVHTDFPTKFGIPRQSNLVKELKGTIVFEPEYRNPDALYGLDGFSHIWLLWQFSENKRSTWSASVRPPRLGGNEYRGVFATRSPFRPNPIGLSSVKLERIEMDPTLGPVLHILGADLMDGTPIYDIKPYLPYTDCHTDATGGFTEVTNAHHLTVEIPESIASVLSSETLSALRGILAQDPRPAYQKDPERIYGLEFAGYEVKFQVDEMNLKVCQIDKIIM